MESASTSLAVDEDAQAHQVGGDVARDLVVERAVAVRRRLQLVVEVEDDLGQRDVVDEHHAGRRRGTRCGRRSRACRCRSASSRRCTRTAGSCEQRAIGSRNSSMRFDSGMSAGFSTRFTVLSVLEDLVGDVGRGLDEVEVARRARAAPGRSPCGGGRGSRSGSRSRAPSDVSGRYVKRRVVERERVEGLPERLVVLRVGRVEAAVDHRLRLAVAGERLDGLDLQGLDDGVADADVVEGLDVGDDVADSPARRTVPGSWAGRSTPTSITSYSVLAPSRRIFIFGRSSPSIRRT